MLAVLFTAACGGAGDGITTPTPDPNRPGAPVTLESPAADVSLTAVGASSLISIVAKDARGIVVPNPTVSWSSVDITVADVSGSGASAVVTARAPGRTIVRARVGVLVQDFSITVVGARGIALTLVATPTCDHIAATAWQNSSSLTSESLWQFIRKEKPFG